MTMDRSNLVNSSKCYQAVPNSDIEEVHQLSRQTEPPAVETARVDATRPSVLLLGHLHALLLPFSYTRVIVLWMVKKRCL